MDGSPIINETYLFPPKDCFNKSANFCIFFLYSKMDSIEFGHPGMSSMIVDDFFHFQQLEGDIQGVSFTEDNIVDIDFFNGLLIFCSFTLLDTNL